MRWSAGLVVVALAALPATPARASGQYLHLAEGDFAVRHLDEDLRRILNDNDDNPCGITESCREIYRNAIVFPDAWGQQYRVGGSENCTEKQASQSGSIIHSPVFMNKLAKEIQKACRDFPPLHGKPCESRPVLERTACRNNESKCEQYITQLMGSVAHSVMDVTFDKLFVNSTAEACDLAIQPNQLLIGEDNVLEAQFYTDQHLDAFLGRGERGPPPNNDGWDDLLPTRLGVSDTVADFLEEKVLPDILPSDCHKDTKRNMIRRQQASSQKKTCGVFTGGSKICKENYKRSCGITRGCGLGCCKNDPDCKKGNACETDGDCEGLLNTCEINPDWSEGPCIDNPLGCANFLDLGNRICCSDPQPTPNGCNWAVNAEDQWDRGPGAIRDTARETAALLNVAWRLLKQGKTVEFEWHTNFADRVICVGEAGTGNMSCSRERAAGVGVLGH